MQLKVWRLILELLPLSLPLLFVRVLLQLMLVVLQLLLLVCPTTLILNPNYNSEDYTALPWQKEAITKEAITKK